MPTHHAKYAPRDEPALPHAPVTQPSLSGVSDTHDHSEESRFDPGVRPFMATSALGILGAIWRQKIIEDTEQIAIWICRGKLVQTPRL